MAVTIRGSGQLSVQIVQTVKTSIFTTTTALPSFTDITGATATITPTNSANKVLVTVTGTISNGSSTYGSAVNLVRGSTSIAVGDARGSATSSFYGSNFTGVVATGNIALCFLDSPATTSATTYKLQLGSESGGTAYIGGSAYTAGASGTNTPIVLTLEEIAYA
jgi:hypothetical protein